MISYFSLELLYKYVTLIKKNVTKQSTAHDVIVQQGYVVLNHIS